MRPINVSLDSVTWELAKQKTNFSQWVRDQLRSEDNKRKMHQQRALKRCRNCVDGVAKHGNAYCKACQIEMGYVEEEE